MQAAYLTNLFDNTKTRMACNVNSSCVLDMPRPFLPIPFRWIHGTVGGLSSPGLLSLLMHPPTDGNMANAYVCCFFLILFSYLKLLFNRPGVAGAVLQTPPLLTD